MDTKLIKETKQLIWLKIFLEKEIGIKYNFNVGELKKILKAITNKRDFA
jgi:hypothetical protein